MHASQITDTMIVKRSRFFSATEAPPIEDDMPPPKRSDMPPPRPLCISTNRDRTTLVRTNTIEKIKIGVVIITIGAEITRASLTHRTWSGRTARSRSTFQITGTAGSQGRQVVEPGD